MFRLFILLFLISPLADAAWETYVVTDDNGDLRIISYNTDSKDSLDDVKNDLGLGNKSHKKIDPELDLPASKEFRGSWEYKNGRVVENEQKKADIAQKRQDKVNKLNSLKARLGIDDDDLKIIRDGV